MMGTKYLCNFLNYGGTRKQILVELDEEDEATNADNLLAAGPDHAEFIAMSAALRKAYRDVPMGYGHTGLPVKVRMLQ
jgi:hypothetical protein